MVGETLRSSSKLTLLRVSPTVLRLPGIWMAVTWHYSYCYNSRKLMSFRRRRSDFEKVYFIVWTTSVLSQSSRTCVPYMLSANIFNAAVTASNSRSKAN